MELISKKSILIIAPSLIAESLSLKLTSLDQNLDINFNNGTGDKTPDLVIWNVLNFQSEDLIRLELLKLREKYDESKFLIILSGELVYEANTPPSLNAEGFLLNPSAEKVLESIESDVSEVKANQEGLLTTIGSLAQAMINSLLKLFAITILTCVVAPIVAYFLVFRLLREVFTYDYFEILPSVYSE